MPVKKSTVARFKLFRNVAKPEYKASVDRVIQLYESRNIGKEKGRKLVEKDSWTQASVRISKTL